MTPNIPEPAATAEPASSDAPLVTDTDGAAYEIPPEVIPRVDDLVIEDGKPVESVFVEKQYRLLTEPLYSSWPGPGEGRPFVALANVGLFHTWREPPLVPDAMLSLDVRGGDLSVKENRSYFVWIRGKAPDAVIEIVSDRSGGEETHKLRSYARIGVPYYAIFDPEEILGGGVLRLYRLHGRTYLPLEGSWLEAVGLGLTLWSGEFENQPQQWLRWCQRDGQPIPTGRERVEQERQRAEQERQRAEQEHLRADSLEAEVARLRALLESQEKAER